MAETLEGKCCVCGESGHKLLPNLVKIRTKYSGTTLFELLERITEQDLAEKYQSLADSAACKSCLVKLNDYDATYTKALIIQKELLELLSNGSIGLSVDGDDDDDGGGNNECGLLDESDVVKHEPAGEAEQEEPDVATEEVVTPGKPIPTISLSIKCRICDESFACLEELKAHTHPTVVELYEELPETGTKHLIIEPVTAILDKAASPALSYTEEEFLEYDSEEMPVKEERDVEIVEKDDSLVSSQYECFYCDETFQATGDRKWHIKQKHPENGDLHTCKVCGLSLKSRAALSSHLQKHPREQLLSCKECNKQFSQMSTLRRHMTIHTRETPYQCHLCGKRYIHYSSFYMHQLAHKNIRAKKCEICGYSLRSGSHLARHMRAHSGEKPYECTECGQRFSQRYNMVSHAKTHQGIIRKRSVKRYPCTQCDETFLRKLLLTSHMQQIHGVKLEIIDNEIDSKPTIPVAE
ncbi:zinc finger protein 14-like [Anopheles albimanus]|uniref:C2H2-type domain-containing protein n=1 Tax=Anopheles albimanus TaxID=7167 RepID=A0A8W7K9W4_ANOAL|nr:zinc finger protein 14-like [Anopheles albimanus]